jgi:branched-chain amino acid transport system substrate-binding protein
LQGFTTSLQGAGWRRIILSQLDHIRPGLGVLLHMSRKRWLSCAAVAAVILSAGACTADEPEGQQSSVREVRLGVLAPRTGASQAAGNETQRGAELAAELVNGERGPESLVGISRGGLIGPGGAKLTIVGADTRSRPEVGAAEAARLVGEERVVGLIGAYDAEVTEVASQRTERLRVPFVNGDSPAGYLTERGLDWFFRAGPTDRMFGESFYSALGQIDDNARRVAVIYTNDRPGNVVADLVEDLGKEGGFQLTARVPVQPGSGDAAAAAAVQQVRAAAVQPDAVFVVATAAADATRLIKAFREVNYTPPGILVFGAGFLPAAVFAAAGDDALGLLSSTAWSREVAGRNPIAKPIMELYEERFGQPMSEVAAGSFTAVLVLAEAVNTAGSIDPQRVRAALLNLDVPGREMIMPWSGVRFDTSHQNTAAAGVVEQRVEGGFRVVFPGELQQAQAVWPLSEIRET